MKEAMARDLKLGNYRDAVGERIESLSRDGFSARLWEKDASLWAGDAGAQAGIENSLGWLDVIEKMQEAAGELEDFASEAAAGFRHAVFMGMGGSSLCPLVFERSFPVGENALGLTVLDTTDPKTVLGIEKKIPLEETLFFVASKSGTTAEPHAFGEYFYGRVRELKGDNAGENFAAVTDPGSPLARQAQERMYHRVFLNFADIGGRFSALSYFGLVPAALMGMNVRELLSRAQQMADRCRAPEAENPGIVLGAAMAELANRGRDKVTLVVPGRISALGAWLEQLLAESTGKEGKGLLPVAGEALGDPSDYADDRLFVYLRLKGEVDEAVEKRVGDLQGAGQPVVTLEMDDPLDLGGEFFRWEVATAAAGAVLGINPFDQPNVQESKDKTNRLLSYVREEGSLPPQDPVLKEGPLSLYAEGAAGNLAGSLAEFFSRQRQGDYVAILAYLAEEPGIENGLARLRLLLRQETHLAVTTGYGPRYLHSTGQLHKGGPNSGLFLQLTTTDESDASIPGEPYSFGVLKSAQAQGDLEALGAHGRRAIRVDLGADAGSGLDFLYDSIKEGFASRRT